MNIRNKLIFIFIPLVSISIIITSIIAIENFLKFMERQMVVELELVASNLMDSVSRQMFEKISDIRFLATNKILNKNSNFTLKEKMDFLRSLEKASKTYGSISLYDINGTKVGDTRNILIGINDSQKSFFKKALKANVYYDVLPIKSPTLNQYVIHFSAAIKDENEKIEGVVVTSYPINKINDLLRQKELSGLIRYDTSETTNDLEVDLISEDGIVIFSNYDRKAILKKNVSNIIHGVEFNYQTNNEYAYSNIEKKHDRHSDVFVIASDKDGYLDYKGGGWLLMVGRNPELFYSDLENLVNQFIIIAGIILILSVIFTLILAKSISKPIFKLRNMVIEASRGNFGKKIDIIGSGEIKELAFSFEKMRQSIYQTNNNLNELVKERTSKLEFVNQNLKQKELQLQKSYDELVAAGKAKEEFMSMVSHELKTPLTPIKLYVELLLKYFCHEYSNGKQREAIETIYRNVLKLEILINDILDIYKLDMEKLNIHKDEVDIEEFIIENVNELKPFLIEKDIIFSFDIKTSGKIYCDSRRIKQVILNLVKNSIDFVSQGGKIILIVEDNKEEKHDQETKPHVIFTVKDNGLGIPKDKIPNLFNKFYQIDTTATRKHGGTGLGLAICKGIVDAHGGYIWIDTEYNHGASIKFSLPR